MSILELSLVLEWGVWLGGQVDGHYRGSEFVREMLFLSVICYVWSSR